MPDNQTKTAQQGESTKQADQMPQREQPDKMLANVPAAALRRRMKKRRMDRGAVARSAPTAAVEPDEVALAEADDDAIGIETTATTPEAFERSPLMQAQVGAIDAWIGGQKAVLIAEVDRFAIPLAESGASVSGAEAVEKKALGDAWKKTKGSMTTLITKGVSNLFLKDAIPTLAGNPLVSRVAGEAAMVGLGGEATELGALAGRPLAWSLGVTLTIKAYVDSYVAAQQATAEATSRAEIVSQTRRAILDYATGLSSAAHQAGESEIQALFELARANTPWMSPALLREHLSHVLGEKLAESGSETVSETLDAAHERGLRSPEQGK